jgi:hypothetical protein
MIESTYRQLVIIQLAHVVIVQEPKLPHPYHSQVNIVRSIEENVIIIIQTYIINSWKSSIQPDIYYITKHEQMNNYFCGMSPLL